LGIDDFALRRGDTYGTVLINIETGKPLELLPDRTAEAVMPWLSTHPEIQVVSRDRASAFADAVSRVLPHATHVADRYHLVQNLRDHLQQFLDRKRTCLPEVEDIPLKEGSTNTQGLRGSLADQTCTVESRAEAPGSQAESTSQPEAQIGPEAPKTAIEQERELACLTYAERKKKISRDKRYARYEHMLALHQAGMGQRAIARELHMSRRIVHRYLSSRGASFLMILPPSKRTQAQQQQVEQMNLNEELRAVYPLSPGVCHHAQRTPGGGVRLLARVEPKHVM
jgi:transposase